MEWTREKTITLIEEYKKRRGLWDMTHEDYRKKDVKRDLLQEVSENMDNGAWPTIEIEKKFHTLRTQYHREINRMKRNEPYNSKWFGFKHLQFLSSPKACRSGRSSKNTNTSQSKDEKSPKCVVRDVRTVRQQESPQTSSITTEFLTILPKPTITYTSNNTSTQQTGRDLEKLIQETTKDADVEETKPKVLINEVTVPIQQMQTNYNNNSNEMMSTENIHIEDHHIETNDQPIEEDTVTYHHHHHPRVIKISNSVCSRRDVSSIEDNSFYEEEMQQTPQQDKRIFINNSTQIRRRSDSPKSHQQTRHINECITFGEYVANEMRNITSRQILTTLKHTINTAIYDANMQELKNNN